MNIFGVSAMQGTKNLEKATGAGGALDNTNDAVAGGDLGTLSGLKSRHFGCRRRPK